MNGYPAAPLHRPESNLQCADYAHAAVMPVRRAAELPQRSSGPDCQSQLAGCLFDQQGNNFQFDIGWHRQLLLSHNQSPAQSLHDQAASDHYISGIRSLSSVEHGALAGCDRALR